MQEFSARSIEQYISIVRSLRARWDARVHADFTEIWFRGVTNEEHLLVPGAYRYQNCDEWSMVLSFRAMAPMLVNPQPEDRWDWYFLMQHYGLPTRLLDWTESALHGLHFALSESTALANPCVWVLEPSAFNQSMHGDDHGFVYVPFDNDKHRRLEPWLPDYCRRDAPLVSDPEELRQGHFQDNAMPLAIYARRTNSRILAQRGVFTVHGSTPIPIEALPIFNRRGEERIARIVIGRKHAHRILKDLYTLGFSHTDTYPEPESIAKDLKRMYRLKPST